MAQFWDNDRKNFVAQAIISSCAYSTMGERSTPSYIAQCIKYLHPDSQPLSTPSETGGVAFLLQIGYKVQDEVLTNLITASIDNARPHQIQRYVEAIFSDEINWKETKFTLFEAQVMSKLTKWSTALTSKLALKLSTCNTDMHTLRSVLLIRPESNNTILIKAIKNCLERFTHPLERIFADDDSKIEWSVVVNFIHNADTQDHEKWLGMICKRDSEGLIPEGISAATAVLDRDHAVVNRRFPGWLARTMSRLTRRFAEDTTLSDQTLEAIRELGNWIYPQSDQ
jgi:hypothetical protein